MWKFVLFLFFVKNSNLKNISKNLHVVYISGGTERIAKFPIENYLFWCKQCLMASLGVVFPRG